MMGKDPIASLVRPLRDEDFHRVSLHSKRRRKVRADTGKRCRESRIVHFRQLFQEGGMRLSSLDITGKDEHTARVSGDAGRGGAFSTFPLFMRRYGGRA
jgi:hypothetical protein